MHVPSLSTARFAVLVALFLVLFTSGIVVGAAGAPLILAQSNSSGSKGTILTSTSTGTTFRATNTATGRALELTASSQVPLKITAPSGKPPMTVNSGSRVTNLNADKLDGKSSAAFLPSATYRTSTYMSVAANAYADITATCDSGDALLSGGYWNVSATSHLYDSYPKDDLASWGVVIGTGASPNGIYVFAVCADFAPAHVATMAVGDPQRDEPLPSRGD